MKRIAAMMVLLLCTFIGKTQTSNSDSIFLNSLFTENVYSAYWLYSGNWFISDSVSSSFNLHTRLDTLFKFKDEDFDQCYANIQTVDSIKLDTWINPTMNYYFATLAGAYKQFNPLYTLQFSLNSKSATSYFTHTPATITSEVKTAFFIIPGSNNNQTTDINRGIGYHNALCYVREFLKTKGDVFIHTKPLEDYRALYRNKKKINTGDYYTPGPNSYVYNYLNSEDKPYGINYLIESFALLKYLRKHYDKVIVLGCSQGGYATVLTTLFAETDASIISSGYSINFDNSASDIYALQQNFGGLVNSIKDTFVRSSLAQKKSDLLFTYGNLDSYYYQLEHDSNVTQNFFSGIVEHASYFYNYTGHSFPPCSTLDTFIARVKAKPKIKVEAIPGCKTDSSKFKLTIIGKLPVKADLYRNASLVESIYFHSKDSLITLNQPGWYQFKFIEDSSMLAGFDSDSFYFKKDTLANFQTVLSEFNCLNQTAKYSIQLDKSSYALAEIFTRVNENPIVLSSSNFPITTTYGNNQVIHFDSIRMQGNCKLILSDSISIQYSNPEFSHSAITSQCDSSLASMVIAVNGSFPPYTVFYSFNNQQDSLILTTDSLFTMSAGIYSFQNIKDQNGCIVPINEVIPIQFIPLSWQYEEPQFNCDSVKYFFSVHFQGTAPYYVYFRKNNQDSVLVLNNQSNLIWLPNGDYSFDSIASSTCTYPILPALNYSLHYEAVEWNTIMPQYSCGSNTTSSVISILNGKPPFSLKYEFNGSLDSILFSGSNSSWVQPNGYYYLDHLEDSLHCRTTIDTAFQLNSSPLTYQQIDSIYVCDSNKVKVTLALTGNPPFTIHGTSNGQPFLLVSSQNEESFWLGNGIHHIDSIQDATCVIPVTDLTYSINQLPLSVQTPYLTTNCESGKSYLTVKTSGGIQPFTIKYLIDGIEDSLITSSADTTWEVYNANYQFLNVSDAQGCVQMLQNNFTVNFHPLSYSIGNSIYSCDSNYTSLPIYLNGNPPFTLHYRKNGLNYSLTSFVSPYNFKMTNGDFWIDSVQDTKCTRVNSPQHFNLQTEILQCVIQSPQFNCNTGLNLVKINFSGNPPFVLHYTRDGVAYNFVTSLKEDSLFLSNGQYHFNLVTDATQCYSILNEGFVIMKNLLNATIGAPSYSCDSNKTILPIQVSGNPPYTIFYRKNGIVQQVSFSQGGFSLYLDNGNYVLDSIVDSSCSSIFQNQNFSFSVIPIDVSLGMSEYICDSNKTKLPIHLEGLPPFTLYFSKDAFVDSIITSANDTALYLNNGNYTFYSATDATGCLAYMNQSLSVNTNSIQISTTSLPYNCNLNTYPMQWHVQGNFPLNLYYTKNGNASSIAITDTQFVFNLDNGDWFFSHVDDVKGCVDSISLSQQITEANAVNATIQYDFYDCLAEVKTIGLQLQGSAPFTLYYRKLGVPNSIMQHQMNTTFEEIDFEVGLFSLDSISDSRGCVLSLNYIVQNTEQVLNLHLIDSTYDCDSTKMKYEFAMEGVSPWILYYHNQITGVTHQMQSNIPNSTVWLDYGVFVLDSLMDNRCVKPLNQIITNMVQPLTSSVGSIQLDCDSQKNYILLHSNYGAPPYTYVFNQDGIIKSYSTYDTISEFYLSSNSTYYWIASTDSLQCTMPLNYLHTNNLLVPNLQELTTTYDCVNDTNRVYFDVENAAGNGIQFTYNSTLLDTLWFTSDNIFSLPNGLYNFQKLLWGNTCTIPIEENLILDNHPVNGQIDSVVTDCIIGKHILYAQFMGKSPWVLTYLHNQDTIQHELIGQQDTLQLDPGSYHFLNLLDDNQCTYTIDKKDTLSSFLHADPLLTLDNHIVISSAQGLNHQWFKNDSLFTSNTDHILKAGGNGSYYCIVEDSAGCFYSSDTLAVNFEFDIRVYPNPVPHLLHILVNYDFEYWEYELHDMLGNLILSGSANNPNLVLDLKHLLSGVYSLNIKRDGKHDVFRILKL